MEKNLLARLLIVLCLTSFPTLSQADLKGTSSSDIMAEVAFLESFLAQPPQNVRIGNSDERAFLDFLSSYAICEGWGFEEYTEFVAAYERELQPFVPAGRTLHIRLLEPSYEARAENVCQVDGAAKLVVEGFFGDTGRYFLGLKRRVLILEAIDARSNEMLRRTLGTYE